MLNTEVLNFISGKRICVLATERLDGSPHAATVHFAHTENPFMFVIQTDPNSLKAESFTTKNEIRVSIVVGLDEEPNGKDITFQLDGVATLIDSNEQLAKSYLDKFEEKKGKWPNDIFLSVVPKWWRYTYWGKTTGKPYIVEMS